MKGNANGSWATTRPALRRLNDIPPAPEVLARALGPRLAVASVTTTRPPFFPAKSGSAPALLAKLRRGDRDAFEVLYEASFFRVYGYFQRRLRSAAEAERATEAALTAVFSGVSEGRSQLPLPRWIFGHVREVERRTLKALPEAVSA